MAHRICKVWVDQAAVHARTEDGLEASYRFEQWPRLRNTNAEQRADFYLTRTGMHWPQVDEDLSFEGMFASAGLCQRTPTEDDVYYEAPYPMTDEGCPTQVAEP